MVPRIGRWWIKIIEFNFDVEHRAGTSLGHVDALSRNPGTAEKEPEKLSVLLNTLELEDWLAIAQREDEKLCKIVEILKNKETTSKDHQRIKEEYTMVDGRLYKTVNNKRLWVVPKRARAEIVRRYHNNVGHPALENTVERIKRFFLVPLSSSLCKGIHWFLLRLFVQ